MKSYELRLFDFVLADGKVVQVNGITKKKIGYSQRPCQERYVSLSNVKPILITDELVEAIKSYYPALHIVKEGDVGGVPFWSVSMKGVFNVSVKYVHQLQQIVGFFADDDYPLYDAIKQVYDYGKEK